VKRYLSAVEVAELAELLEDPPRRVGVVDEVLQAADDGRGTLRLAEPEPEADNEPEDLRCPTPMPSASRRRSTPPSAVT
jgi:hypothetical protein